MGTSPADWASGLFAVYLAIVGLCVGSFLNVVIYRLPEGLSIVKPRSRCPNCKRQLTWYENVPVFSWLIQRGRCRGCQTSISLRYPAIELLTGVLFVASLARFGWTPELVRALLLVCVLVPLTFIDLDHWLLPYELTLPGIALGLLTAPLLGLPALRDAVIGAALGFLVFWAMEFVGEKIFKKEALGGGDKFLLALIGAFLGYQSLLGVIFLSSLQGAIVGSLLLLVRGRAGPAPVEAPPDAQKEEPKPEEPKPEEPPSADAGKDGEEGEEEDDWVPGPTNIPFGPWLAIAALELMFLAAWLEETLPPGLSPMFGGILR